MEDECQAGFASSQEPQKKGHLTPQGAVFCFSLQYSFLEDHEQQQKVTLAVFSPRTICFHSPMEVTAKACPLSCAHFILYLTSGMVIAYQPWLR